MTRNRSQTVLRSKSPISKPQFFNKINVFAAGVSRMNPSLYSKPWKKGLRNPKFKHPNYQSNLIFYETTPNMNVASTTKFKTQNSMIGSFMDTVKANKSITRQNNFNKKNESSFEFSSIPKSKSFVHIPQNRSKSPVNIWRYKDSPYGKPNEQEAHYSDKNNDSNVLKNLRKVQRAALELNDYDLVELPNKPTDSQVPNSKAVGYAKEGRKSERIHSVTPVPKHESEMPRQEGSINLPQSKATKQTPAFISETVQKPHEPDVVVCDLQEERVTPQRYYQTNNDGYSASANSNAFDQHLERQEQEKYKRYVTNYRKDQLINPDLYEDNSTKTKYFDRSVERTNGVTLEFSGDPMLKTHMKRNKLREQLTSR